MSIELRPINAENWEECIGLGVSPEQDKFVAPNWYSLLQAIYEKDIYVNGIYNEEGKAVGFVMYDINPDYVNTAEQRIEMSRLMIDKKYQKKGYGKEAIEKVIDLVRQKYGHIPFYTSIEPENDVARKLYESLGFEKTGEIEYEEEVLKIQL